MKVTKNIMHKALDVVKCVQELPLWLEHCNFVVTYVFDDSNYIENYHAIVFHSKCFDFLLKFTQKYVTSFYSALNVYYTF